MAIRTPIVQTRAAPIRRGIQVFRPTDLFTGGEAGLAFAIQEAVLQGRIWQDSAGTIPANKIDDPVGRLDDLSGNGNNLTQSTAAARPLLKKDANGIWHLKFDGVDDFLLFGTFALPAEHFMAVAYDTDGETSGLFWYRNGASSSWMNVFESGSSNTSISSSEDDLNFQNLWVDGAVQSVATRGDVYAALAGKHVSVFENTTTGQNFSWAIGDYGSPYSLSGRLYALLWRDRMTAAERSSVEKYFAAQSGVTL